MISRGYNVRYYDHLSFDLQKGCLFFTGELAGFAYDTCFDISAVATLKSSLI